MTAEDELREAIARLARALIGACEALELGGIEALPRPK